MVPLCFIGWQWFNVKQALTVGQDLKGKITVVDFFTYCCINCMHILPDLHALEEKYTSEQHGVAVVSVLPLSSHVHVILNKLFH